MTMYEQLKVTIERAEKEADELFDSLATMRQDLVNRNIPVTDVAWATIEARQDVYDRKRKNIEDMKAQLTQAGDKA